MGAGEQAADTPDVSALIRKGFIVYLVVVPIFLLFIAVLAYGWFYWQRAKARDAGRAADSGTAVPATDQ
jgi:hypothetical protein